MMKESENRCRCDIAEYSKFSHINRLISTYLNASNQFHARLLFHFRVGVHTLNEIYLLEPYFDDSDADYYFGKLNKIGAFFFNGVEMLE